MIRFLDIEEALGQVAGLGFTVKDVGLLDSAIMRPQASAFGEYAYPNIETMAAAMTPISVTSGSTRVRTAKGAASTASVSSPAQP